MLTVRRLWSKTPPLYYTQSVLSHQSRYTVLSADSSTAPEFTGHTRTAIALQILNKEALNLRFGSALAWSRSLEVRRSHA